MIADRTAAKRPNIKKTLYSREYRVFAYLRAQDRAGSLLKTGLR